MPTYPNAKQMEAMGKPNVRVVDQYVGVLMKMERKYLIPDKMEIQIAASQVLDLRKLLLNVNFDMAFATAAASSIEGASRPLKLF